MNFLNQPLLWGLTAVSLPVLIHLLNRRRFRKVPWAAMRFLKISVDQNQRRMKLEDWILLLVRCAMIALLAALMARPVMEGLSGVPGSKVAAAIIVDNSASMGTREDEFTRLSRAREAAHAILSGLPDGTSVALAGAFHAHEASNDLELVSSRIDRISQTDRHADLQHSLEVAARALDGQAASVKELYLVTDAHAPEWGSFGTLESQLREISMGIKVHLVTVGAPVGSNLAITSLRPAAALPSVNQPFRVDVDVTNHGSVSMSTVPVQLLVDGRPEGEPWIIPELKAGGRQSATLYASLPSPGYHRVTVMLEGDEMPFDDRRTVVMNARDEVSVLLVDGDPGQEARDSETFFLRHALAPVPGEEQADYPVQPSVISVSDLGGEDLDRHHAVVLANVADVPLGLADRLAAYVKAGGGLIIFAGANLRPESYNTLLHRKHGLLPVTFSYEEEVPVGPRRAVPPDTNPLELDGDLLARVTFREALGLKAGDMKFRPALRYDDGELALVESEYGRGKVFVFNSSVDLEWNDFAIRPAFVPFVNRLLGRIVQNREGGLNVEAGQTLRHRANAALAGRPATVYEMGDPEALGYLTTLSEGEGSSILEFDRADRAGAYQVAIEGEAEPVLFSVRPSDRESTPELLGSQQLDRLGASVELYRWDSDREQSLLRKKRKGAELWWPLLLVVIGFAGIEMVLAQWFSRSK